MTIAPPSDGDRTFGDAEVPVFNKPIMQFPYFSKSPHISDMNGFANTGTVRGSDSAHGTMRSHGTVRSIISQGTIPRSLGQSMATGAQRSNSIQSNGKVPRRSKYDERDDRVTTTYKPKLRCCVCCTGCLGYGIYD